MNNLIKKLPSEAFFKKLIILSLGLFVLSVVYVFATLLKVYSLAGAKIDDNITTVSLDSYQDNMTTAIIIIRVCIVVMVIAGAILAYQHEVRKTKSK